MTFYDEVVSFDVAAFKAEHSELAAQHKLLVRNVERAQQAGTVDPMAVVSVRQLRADDIARKE